MASLLDHNVADSTEKKNIEKIFVVKIVFGLEFTWAWVDKIRKQTKSFLKILLIQVALLKLVCALLYNIFVCYFGMISP